MTEPQLCVFARAPELGVVKRRLAAEIGDRAALEAHQRLVEDTLGRLGRVPGVTTVLWIGGAPNATVARWARTAGVAVRQQQGDDLGDRMQIALTAALAHASKAILVGSDCPDIDADYVLAALDCLDDHDVVLGPAEDGGYGLVGARRAVRDRLDVLFQGMAWGRADVLDVTHARARAAGLTVALLATVWDVDTADDWRRFLAAR